MLQPRRPQIWENVLGQAGLGSQPASPEEAENVAKGKLSANYVLAGRVESLSARTDKDEAVLEVAFVPVAVPAAAGRPAESLAGGPSVAAAAAASGPRAIRFRAEALHDRTSLLGRVAAGSYSWPARVVVWLLLAALLPLAAAPLLSHGLEKRSNGINLLMLVGLTAMAAVAAYALAGFRLDTVWTAALSVAGTCLALLYNWSVLEKLQTLRE